jgi:acyl-CoA synthetase (AMP-forming)/AMP-acid ligase II
MLRSQLVADPSGRFLHDLILESCHRFASRIALVDTSSGRRLSYAEYGDLVCRVAKGFVSAGVMPGEVIAIFLPNSWEFCVAYHATTLAGAIPTLLNPSYREREVRYQLENSQAVLLVSDGPQLDGLELAGPQSLRNIYTTRRHLPGVSDFGELLRVREGASLPEAMRPTPETLAALPYSSGTTGMPKGVMLSHFNLVSNIFQIAAPDAFPLAAEDVLLCFLPLYHIYGLNVALNPSLIQGATIVLMPRFNPEQFLEVMVKEGATVTLVVPPALLSLVQSVEKGLWPKSNRLQRMKSGAAPLATDVPRRFTSLTGVPVVQGYGMTEASPVTHLGFFDSERNRPASIGQPLAKTDCQVLVLDGSPAGDNDPGELIMRGPQFMSGYWRSPDATAAALRDGWFWSGDIVTRDAGGYYYVLDRRREMIKYKGFSVAPAEIESVLLEHPAVRDCGVVGRKDAVAGEIPVAFVVTADNGNAGSKLAEELCDFVAGRLAHYKQPREVRFLDAIPKTGSGKILRRELRKALE